MLIGIFIQDFKIYRGINYIPITNTESFSALIGENGIGKSSIFEALDTLFNDSTWKINNNARSSSITALFAVDRKDIEAKNRSYENLRNKSKHLSYLELVDSIIRGCGIKDINTNQHIQDAVNKFLEHRDKIVGQFNSDTLFCLSGITSQEEDPKLIKLLEGMIEKQLPKDYFPPTLEKLVKYGNQMVSDLYSYIHIPVEVDADSFSKLESANIQKLIGRDVTAKIFDFITQEEINELNDNLENFVEDISAELDSYEYRKIEKTLSNLRPEHIKDIVIEAFFSKMILTKETDQGSVDVKELSSGEKRKALTDLSLSFLNQSTSRSKKIIIAFDEPEASLHVSACFDQYRKIQEISDLYCQTLVATHWYGFIPIISSGNVVYLSRPSESQKLSPCLIPLHTFDEQAHKEVGKLGPGFSLDIDLKSKNDLVQSIFHSIKIEKPINWIICEGSTDKKYIEYYLKDHLENLSVIAVGGNGSVKNLYDYLYVPLKRIRNEPGVTGKVLCLIDTDQKLLKFDNNDIKSVLQAIRLFRDEHGDYVSVKDTNDPNHGVSTDVEASLEAELFVKTIVKLALDNEGLQKIIENVPLPDKNISSGAFLAEQGSLLVRSMKDYFKVKTNKAAFCEEYIKQESKDRPLWIKEIEEYFNFQPKRKVLSLKRNSHSEVDDAVTSDA